jgi:hypothetical protein
MTGKTLGVFPLIVASRTFPLGVKGMPDLTATMIKVFRGITV